MFRGTGNREELYLSVADLSVGILIVDSQKMGASFNKKRFGHFLNPSLDTRIPCCMIMQWHA
jgi:hypothetical protein